jgi:hypothetical protein
MKKGRCSAPAFFSRLRGGVQRILDDGRDEGIVDLFARKPATIDERTHDQRNDFRSVRGWRQLSPFLGAIDDGAKRSRHRHILTRMQRSQSGVAFGGLYDGRQQRRPAAGLHALGEALGDGREIAAKAAGIGRFRARRRHARAGIEQKCGT